MGKKAHYSLYRFGIESKDLNSVNEIINFERRISSYSDWPFVLALSVWLTEEELLCLTLKIEGLDPHKLSTFPYNKMIGTKSMQEIPELKKYLKNPLQV